MPTECTPDLFDLGRVEGRRMVAAFDGGRVNSDAGALLLGATVLTTVMRQAAGSFMRTSPSSVAVFSADLSGCPVAMKGDQPVSVCTSRRIRSAPGAAPRWGLK